MPMVLLPPPRDPRQASSVRAVGVQDRLTKGIFGRRSLSQPYPVLVKRSCGCKLIVGSRYEITGTLLLIATCNLQCRSGNCYSLAIGRADSFFKRYYPNRFSISSKYFLIGTAEHQREEEIRSCSETPLNALESQTSQMCPDSWKNVVDEMVELFCEPSGCQTQGLVASLQQADNWACPVDMFGLTAFRPRRQWTRARQRQLGM